jgi:hypothetical protein
LDSGGPGQEIGEIAVIEEGNLRERAPIQQLGPLRVRQPIEKLC